LRSSGRRRTAFSLQARQVGAQSFRRSARYRISPTGAYRQPSSSLPAAATSPVLPGCCLPSAEAAALQSYAARIRHACRHYHTPRCWGGLLIFIIAAGCRFQAFRPLFTRSLRP
jgi:hypothetical protein